MKTITRRLRRLEERFSPLANEEDFRLSNILRERRRRRLEASGERFDDLPLEEFDRTQRAPHSIADILRSRYDRPRAGSPD
jgi:hypothetical protein